MSKVIRKEDALEYHTKGRPGKIEVLPTKDTKTQRDLSLAYSPGVAEPCKENNIVSFETEMGPKGANAINVKLVK